MKYGNHKTTLYGITFDSKAEAERYLILRDEAAKGRIADLRLQVPYELIPKQKGERPVIYIADFVYTERGRTVVEDVKGYATREYVLKRKLFKFRYPELEFREIKG